MTLRDRIVHAWNAFNGSTDFAPVDEPTTYAPRFRGAKPSTSTFASAIYNRIALDVALTSFTHVKENEETEDIEVIKSGLNYCLNTEANIDQSNLAFLHDVVYSMFDEGAVAIVPVETTLNPKVHGSFDILSLRTGQILEFKTKSVKLRVFNDETGRFDDIWLPKSAVAIIENPLYSVINEPNSTLQRLLNKMSLIDNYDATLATGRVDAFIQLPYAIRTDRQLEQAQGRLKMIDQQLRSGKHGIAYIDGTEKVVQLNRPLNNNLLESVKMLSEQFYNQLGLTATVFDGTATEAQMRNYYSRTVDPIVEFIVKELERKFFTKTARTQGHKINFNRNNFKMVPVETIVNLGDAFRRNQIATSNEIRRLVGFKTSNDPLADQLSNPNIADSNKAPMIGPQVPNTEEPIIDEELQNENI